MAYNYDGIATTQKGKIIYPRKKNPFKSNDLGRVGRSIGLPRDPLETYRWILAMADIIAFGAGLNHSDVAAMCGKLSAALKVLAATAEEFEGFGGGEFGGAGASGTFLQPFPVGQ